MSEVAPVAESVIRETGRGILPRRTSLRGRLSEQDLRCKLDHPRVAS